MRTDADGPLPLLDLDVEAQLAAVDDLAQLGVGRAGLALGGRGDVLHTHLEADRRVPLLQVLEDQGGGVALDHPDHSRRREDARADRAADVGQQPALDGEVHRPLHPGLERHYPTIPMPPEAPMHSPVTYEASS